MKGRYDYSLAKKSLMTLIRTFRTRIHKWCLLMDDQSDYSVGKEIMITLFIGFVIGMFLLVTGIGLVEFLKG